LITKIIIM